MGRQVVTQRDIDLAWKKQAEPMPDGLRRAVVAIDGDGADDATNPLPKSRGPDQFTDRLLKYIPAEVIIVYVSVEGLIRNAPANVPREKVLWVVFLFLLIATWIYLARVQHVNKKAQLVISTLAFAVWVFSLGGPFASFSWYEPFYGALLLPLYTFGISALKPESH
jgi:hypothetical protein